MVLSVAVSASRARSLTLLPLLLLDPYARPYSGAQINALRAQLDAQPDAKRPRHERETTRSHSCRAPFLSHHAQAYPNLALAPPAPPLRPAAVLAGWVSVDLRGLFSHDHLGEFVYCNVA